MRLAMWFLISLSVAVPPSHAAAPLPSTLKTRANSSASVSRLVRTIAAQHHGQVALYAENLKTRETVEIDAYRPVQTASVIKLAILFEAMEQARAGRVQLSQPMQLKAADRVTGSGILQLFSVPATFTLHDILMLMITQSDNTATNLAIDTLGLDTINQEIRQLGLTQTWLYKKISQPPSGPMPSDQKLFGLGKTTAREMAALMTRIYTCAFTGVTMPGDNALCVDMLNMLQKQSFREGIPRYLERGDTSEQADASIGNKTGALNKVRNDVGLISTKSGPVVISIFTYNNTDQGWYSDNEGEVTIARISKVIVNGWSPAGLSAEGYKPLIKQTR